VPKSYGPIECGRPGIELEVTLRSGSEMASERERRESARERSATSASVTVEAPLPGGLGVSGGASWEQAAGRARGFSTAYGNTLLRQQETTVTYGIASAHDYHFSDHEVYPLHLLHTVRSWEPVERSEVPRELTGLPTTGWRWLGDRAFARLGGDAYVMRTAGGGWYASGPPVTTTREIGLYMARVAERFCHPPRDETVPMPREEAEPPAVPTPSGRDVDGEHDLVVSTDAGASPPVTLTFLALHLEATATDLVRGQRSTAKLVVEGTAKRLCVRVTNETPQVISLKGGETVHVVTGGGEPNGAELRFTAVGPGAFSIQAEVLSEDAKGCRGR
jgi:hypothetical protein